MKSGSNTDSDVELIRLFFPVPLEEKIAVRWARVLASVLGDQVAQLRPETTLTEIFKWAELCSLDLVEFILSLEQELGWDLEEFLDDFDQTTFRELVRHAARRQDPTA